MKTRNANNEMAAGLRLECRCNPLALQEGIFCTMKGHILHDKRASFALQKVPF